jgi:hypothetical protein
MKSTVIGQMYTPIFSTIMSRDKYFLLLRILLFVNNNSRPQNDDKLWPIQCMSTSPTLLSYLYDRKTNACGTLTVRKNRKGMPEFATKLKKREVE